MIGKPTFQGNTRDLELFYCKLSDSSHPSRGIVEAYAFCSTTATKVSARTQNANTSWCDVWAPPVEVRIVEIYQNLQLTLEGRNRLTEDIRILVLLQSSIAIRWTIIYPITTWSIFVLVDDEYILILVLQCQGPLGSTGQPGSDESLDLLGTREYALHTSTVRLHMGWLLFSTPHGEILWTGLHSWPTALFITWSRFPESLYDFWVLYHTRAGGIPQDVLPICVGSNQGGINYTYPTYTLASSFMLVVYGAGLDTPRGVSALTGGLGENMVYNRTTRKSMLTQSEPNCVDPAYKTGTKTVQVKANLSWLLVWPQGENRLPKQLLARSWRLVSVLFQNGD